MRAAEMHVGDRLLMRALSLVPSAGIRLPRKV
jgi:hypothetical protein